MERVVHPQLVSLDSSVIAAWSRDLSSSKPSDRRSATSLIEAITEAGWVVTLSWHQFEEVARHPDRAERIALLRSLPAVAWFASSAYLSVLSIHPHSSDRQTFGARN